MAYSSGLGLALGGWQLLVQWPGLPGCVLVVVVGGGGGGAVHGHGSGCEGVGGMAVMVMARFARVSGDGSAWWWFSKGDLSCC